MIKEQPLRLWNICTRCCSTLVRRVSLCCLLVSISFYIYFDMNIISFLRCLFGYLQYNITIYDPCCVVDLASITPSANRTYLSYNNLQIMQNSNNVMVNYTEVYYVKKYFNIQIKSVLVSAWCWFYSNY